MIQAANPRGISSNRPTIWAVVISATLYQLSINYYLTLPSAFVAANLILLIITSLMMMAGSRYGAGIYQSIAVFFFIFFGVVPPLQLGQGIVFWGAGYTVLEYYTPATAVAIVAILAFHTAYYCFSTPEHRRFQAQARKPDAFRLLAISATAALAIYAVNSFSIESVFIRSGESKSISVENGSIRLIFSNFIFPIPTIALVIHLLSTKRRMSLTTVGLVILFLLANPITGMARFQGAALYLAVLLSFFPSLLMTRLTIPAVLCSGMLLIFPLLNVFRSYSGGTFNYEASLNFVSAAHFDSFQSLANAISVGSVEWGRQAIGALLFFIPRSVWPDKPIGSGAHLAEQQGFMFSNISMNFIGEGYINFHLAGAVGFMIALGVLVGRIERGFWMQQTLDLRFSTQYLLLIGLFFFVMRGDLMSSFAFTVGMMTCVFVVAALTLKKMPAPRHRSYQRFESSNAWRVPARRAWGERPRRFERRETN